MVSKLDRYRLYNSQLTNEPQVSVTWGEGDLERTMEANDRRLRGDREQSVSVKVTAPLSIQHLTVILQS